MKTSTKEKLKQAMEICEEEDRSTAYMIQFMMDYANVPHECVIKYLTTEGGFVPC